MALLQPGWPQDYEGRPPIYPMACLGRIVSHCQLDDGSYNVLLLGLRRVRLVEELPPTKSFREAQVEVCADAGVSEEEVDAQRLRAEIRQSLRRVFPRLPQAQEQLDQLLARNLPMGVIADLVAYLLDISLPEKQALLGELDVCRRVETLLPHLSRLMATSAESGAAFPPTFSAN